MPRTSPRLTNVMTTDIPERSLQQRMDALQNANRIRTFRSDLKLEIKAGRKEVADVLLNPPLEVATMKVFDLLLSAPKMGRVKVNRLITHCRISPSKTVEGLSERQRGEIVMHLRRR